MTVNEVGRLVIRVPGGDGQMGLGSRYVAVALEVKGGVLSAASVTRHPEYAYSVIGRACDTRAVEVVGGELLVGGKEVTPEVYLKGWREALAQAVSPAAGLELHGVKVTLVARGNMAAQTGKPKQWTYDPKDGFDQWVEQLYGRFRLDKDGYFEVDFELEEADAYKTWEILCGYRDYRDNSERNQPEMRIELGAGVQLSAHAVTTPEQAPLFG